MDFHGTQKFAKQLCEYFLQRISPKSHSMGREHKYKLIYAPAESVAGTVPVVMGRTLLTFCGHLLQ
jgi:hypothetical protein